MKHISLTEPVVQVLGGIIDNNIPSMNAMSDKAFEAVETFLDLCQQKKYHDKIVEVPLICELPLSDCLTTWMEITRTNIEEWKELTFEEIKDNCAMFIAAETLCAYLKRT